MPIAIPLRAVRAALAGLALSACAAETTMREAERPETAIPAYAIALDGAPDDAFRALAEESLAVWRLRGEGAPSLAFLRRRAEGDLPTIDAMLRAEGWYEGSAEVAVAPGEDGAPLVRFTVTPGRRFTLARHRLVVVRAEGPVPELDAAALGSPVGEAARAAPILTAEDAAIAALRRAGFAYARFLGRDAAADPEAATIEVASRIAAGRAHVFGPVRFEGVTAVPEDYLATYIPWSEGAPFDAARLREFQRELQDTGLFLSVSAEPPRQAPATADLPVTVRVEERKPRTVALALKVDTVDGPEATASLTHRNLFGRNEEATATAEAGLETQRLAFDIARPQWRRDGQKLLSGLEFRRETGEAYDELGATLTLGVERQVAPDLKAGFGGLLEASRIDDQRRSADVFLAGLPGFVAIDRSDDLLDPTRGWRLGLAVTPFAGQNDEALVAFTTLEATASAYWPLDTEGRTVLALRGRAGTILAEDLGTVPATRRFYAGGGGSVRGFAKDEIGALDGRNDPVGGLSVLEAGIELRHRFTETLGAAAFLEAGAVSPALLPDFRDGIAAAAGLGLRYFSPVGPIRLDVAAPLDPRRSDAPFQIYFAIGQAF